MTRQEAIDFLAREGGGAVFMNPERRKEAVKLLMNIYSYDQVGVSHEKNITLSEYDIGRIIGSVYYLGRSDAKEDGSLI